MNIYAVGFVYWPLAQTINFWLVKPKNQVIYASFASLIWTTFLAYIKVSFNVQPNIKLIYNFLLTINYLLQSHPIDDEMKSKVRAEITGRYEHLKEIAHIGPKE
jgi:hypothetical protein